VTASSASDTVRIISDFSISSSVTCVDFSGKSNITIDMNNRTITSNSGAYFLNNVGSNVEVKYGTITGNTNYDTMRVTGTNLTVHDVTFTNNAGSSSSGINCNSYNNLYNNRFTNVRFAIYLAGNNSVMHDTVINNTQYSIQVVGYNNVIYNNYIGYSGNAAPASAALLITGFGNNVTNVTIEFGNPGLKLSQFSAYNTIKDSFFIKSTYGVYLYGTGSTRPMYNTFYNNYFNNTANYYNGTVAGSINYWNVSNTTGTNIVGGLYTGGNYWGNYTHTGFSDTCTNAGIGFCNSTYTVDTNNFDYLPLTNNSVPDTTPPSITIFNPIAGLYNLSTLQLDVDANESINTWWQQVNGSSNTTFIANSTINLTGDGTKVIDVYANDSSGNIGSARVIVDIDTNPPDLFFVSPTPDDSEELVVNYVLINVTSDEVITQCTLEWNFATSYNMTIANGSHDCYYNVTNLSNDDYTYYATGINIAHNLNQSEQRMVTINYVPPQPPEPFRWQNTFLFAMIFGPMSAFILIAIVENMLGGIAVNEDIMDKIKRYVYSAITVVIILVIFVVFMTS
jgi:hypothetical protein